MTVFIASLLITFVAGTVFGIYTVIKPIAPLFHKLGIDLPGLILQQVLLIASLVILLIFAIYLLTIGV